MVVVVVLLLPPIKVDAVVVEARVADQSHPLRPARRDVLPIVLIQVLPEVPYTREEGGRSVTGQCSRRHYE